MMLMSDIPETHHHTDFCSSVMKIKKFFCIFRFSFGLHGFDEDDENCENESLKIIIIIIICRIIMRFSNAFLLY